MAATNNIQTAARDIEQSVRLSRLWWRLGLEQTITRYRRTLLGPFWLASSTLATGFALTVVFGAIFGNDFRKSLPFILAGVVSWSLISGIIIEGASTFITASGTMQVHRLPLTFHSFLQMDKLLITFTHQVIAFWFVMAVARLFPVPHWQVLLSVPLVLATGLCLSLPIGMLSTRFRDFNFLVGFLMQMAFMLSPVFWKRAQVPPKLQWIVTMNPLAHLLEIIRQPFLGHPAPLDDWAASIMILLVSAAIGFVSLALFRRRVVFWL